MSIRSILICVILPALCSSQLSVAGESWPQFRGTNAQGVNDGANLPASWDVKSGENIRWKAEIPGLGLSSPIAWKNRVFVTTAVGGGDKGGQLKVGLYGDPTSINDSKAEFSWRTLCLDLVTGKVLWDEEAHHGTPKTKRHPKSSHANPTPATDGEHLIVFFGSEGLYCYDLSGKLQWKKDLGVLDAGAFDDRDAQWGFGSSPVICDGKVIVQCDVQDDAFLAAFDVKDGRELWRTKRNDVCTWGTPAVLKTDEGTQVICNGFKHIGGYDLASGKEVWKLHGGGDAPVASPIVANDLIFITNAHGAMAPIYAIDTSVKGKIPSPSENSTSRFISWFVAKGGNYMQTPIAYRDLIYFCRDNGVMTCYEPKSGEKKFADRLGKGNSGFTASPVAADGKIYYTSEDGDVYVVNAEPKLEPPVVISMGESCMATPAIAGDTLLIRGQKHLFAVGYASEGNRPAKP
ncbi:MAG TPA: PQQ-binding-like beta-propeller repeat protein [Phycisphaerae bacterium]|nr:PQQ-binding-like beta-propeller repeat protein [Phycisphaerae bacterium]